MDRIPSAVPTTNHDMIDLLGKEEAMEMFLNGFARQVSLPSCSFCLMLISAHPRPSGRKS